MTNFRSSEVQNLNNNWGSYTSNCTISSQEQEIIHRIISGEKIPYISKVLKLSTVHLRNLLKRNDVIEEMRSIRKDIKDKFIDNMSDKSKRLQIEKDILETASIGAKFLKSVLQERSDVSVINATSKDVIMTSLEALKLAGYGDKTNTTQASTVNVTTIVDLASVDKALKEMKEWEMR